jgi:cellulose synthase/poly-beta-1,6-N-acetylglucosamine synthase-like glycosyltransferase
MISSILILLAILYILLIFLSIYGWKKTKIFSPEKKGLRTRVSVIVPARNEELNILHCLDAIAVQSFPKELIEVIIVDDHSDDKTLAIINGWADEQTFNTKTISLSSGTGKKQAISEAIKTATGELIVTTDADCTMSREWLLTIVAYYEKHSPEMIVGMVTLNEKKYFLSLFQSLELIGLTGIGGAGIYFDRPLLCNGANLAYTKKAFEETGGYHFSEKSSSGDDTTLMFRVAKKNIGSVHFLKSLQAVVYTNPVSSWAELMNQRKRWGSKVIRQGNFSAIAISLLVFSDFVSWKIPVLLLLMKVIPEFVLLRDALSFYQKKISAINIFLSQLLYAPYLIIAVLLSQTGKYMWKGRKVR